MLNFFHNIFFGIASFFIAITGIFYPQLSQVPQNPAVIASSTMEAVDLLKVATTTTENLVKVSSPVISHHPTFQNKQPVREDIGVNQPPVLVTPVIPQPISLPSKTIITEEERLRQIQIQKGIENDEALKDLYLKEEQKFKAKRLADAINKCNEAKQLLVSLREDSLHMSSNDPALFGNSIKQNSTKDLIVSACDTLLIDSLSK